MKKHDIIFVICIIFILLTGCGNENNPINEMVEKCEYKIEKIEELTKNSTNAIVAELSFEIPIFENSNYNTITEAMKKEQKLFFENNKELFSFYVSIGEDSDYREGYFPYYCKSSITDAYCMNGYCSIITNFEWYAGGTSSVDLIPYNYSLDTGSSIVLSDVCKIEESKLKEIILQELKKQGIECDEYVKETIDEYEIDEFEFYFNQEGIFIVFMTGEVGCNADGCIVIQVEK